MIIQKEKTLLEIVKNYEENLKECLNEKYQIINELEKTKTKNKKLEKCIKHLKYEITALIDSKLKIN